LGRSGSIVAQALSPSQYSLGMFVLSIRSIPVGLNRKIAAIPSACSSFELNAGKPREKLRDHPDPVDARAGRQDFISRLEIGQRVKPALGKLAERVRDPIADAEMAGIEVVDQQRVHPAHAQPSQTHFIAFQYGVA
jgi:hypothetical protein